MIMIRIIKTTDGRFRGLVLSGSTLEQAIMPLIEEVGDFTSIKITEGRLQLQNSNYTIIAKII